MYKAAVLVLVVTGVLFQLEAWAQDRAVRAKFAEERASVSVRAPEKPAPKDAGVQPAPTNNVISVEIQTPDIMTYLLDNKGKIPLYSGMLLHGKIHVELGLFGYLGIKYQF